jgi:hypothetical protein
MNRVSTFIAASVLLLGQFSCRKFLDHKGNNQIASPSTLADVQAILDFRHMTEQRTPSMLEACADNYFILDTRFNGSGTYLQRLYLWQLYEYNLDNDWETSYLPIYRANLALEALDKIPRTIGNGADWDNAKGSALFFRSYYFLGLAWVYAKAYDQNTAENDLGIALRLWSDYNRPTVRSNVQESYERIIADAKSSLDYLPTVPLHCLRPSKGAAYAVLARTYLSMRLYDSALKYSDLSLQVNNQLMNYNKSNAVDPDIPGNFQNTASPFRRFNRETIFYTENQMVGGIIASFSNTKIDTLLYMQYDSNDLRKKAFFNQLGSYYRFKGSYSQLDNNILFSGITTAEMLLTRAECKVRKADLVGALLDLNTLLANRYSASFVPVTANDASLALDRILRERRKELVLRGVRLMDVKRLNKEGANIILKRRVNGQDYILPPNDDRYAFPIPKQVIDLTGIPQNPGW